MFDKALNASTDFDNRVFKTAEKLIGKGYPEAEILEILEKLAKSLIEDKDALIVREAITSLTEVE